MAFTPDAEHQFGADSIVRRYRLDSGLRVVVARDPAAPIVAYQTWFGVGSSHESPGKTGIAHLFEHLMFNQTQSLAPGEYDRVVEQTGGNSNAATWVDWTYYQLSLPSRDLELAARLESERMQRLTLDSEQLECEREVVINERLERVEDDVDGYLDEQLHRIAFTVHPYHWPTIGWMDDIRGLSLDDIRSFYRTFYAPNNATVVIVGDVDEAAALELVERYYGDLPPSTLPQDRRAMEPEQTAPRREDFAKPVAAPRIVCGYRAPGQGEPDWMALEVIAIALAGSPAARLRRRLIDDLEIASQVECGVSPFRDPGLFRIAISANRGETADRVLAEVDACVAELAAAPLPEAELRRAKAVLETGMWSELETADGRAEAFGHFETIAGDFRELFRASDRIAGITGEDTQRVARDYLSTTRRSIVAAIPEVTA